MKDTSITPIKLVKQTSKCRTMPDTTLSLWPLLQNINNLKLERMWKEVISQHNYNRKSLEGNSIKFCIQGVCCILCYFQFIIYISFTHLIVFLIIFMEMPKPKLKSFKLKLKFCDRGGVSITNMKGLPDGIVQYI